MKEKSRSGSFYVATLGGVGRFPVAPGTAAVVVWGIPCYLLLGRLPLLSYSLLLLLLAGVGIWASGRTEAEAGRKDPSFIVVDELAGYLAAVWGLPFGWKTALWAFVGFRFFDIAKPFPINRVDAHLPGGWGVMADDLLAGLCTNAVIRIAAWIAPSILS